MTNNSHHSLKEKSKTTLLTLTPIISFIPILHALTNITNNYIIQIMFAVYGFGVTALCFILFSANSIDLLTLIVSKYENTASNLDNTGNKIFNFIQTNILITMIGLTSIIILFTLLSLNYNIIAIYTWLGFILVTVSLNVRLLHSEGTMIGDILTQGSKNSLKAIFN